MCATELKLCIKFPFLVPLSLYASSDLTLSPQGARQSLSPPLSGHVVVQQRCNSWAKPAAAQLLEIAGVPAKGRKGGIF